MTVFKDSTLRSEGYYDIPVSNLEEMASGVQIIDVREPDEFNGDLGHLPGARLVPLATLEQAAGNWDVHRPYLVVCRSGRRSRAGAITLKKLGFHEVGNLSGGMMAVRSG